MTNYDNLIENMTFDQILKFMCNNFNCNDCYAKKICETWTETDFKGRRIKSCKMVCEKWLKEEI